MLTTKKKLYSRIQLAATVILLLSLQACNKPVAPKQDHTQGNSNLGEDTYISITRGTTPRSSSVNSNDEDYVKEVRLIMVDPSDKSIVLNKLLTFPNNDVGSNSDGYSHLSAPEKIKAGTYTLYCVANETSHPSITAALGNLANEAGIAELIADFELSFKPDKNSGKGLLMTASKEVTLEPGKDYLNPNRVKVDLVRAVAKLDITFKRPINSPAEKLGLYISEVTMGKIPSQYYLFPHATKPYAGALTLEHDYSTEPEGNPLAIPFEKTLSRYMPEYKDGTNPIELKISIKQANTAVERTQTVKLASKEGGQFVRNQYHRYNFILRDWSDIAVQFEVGDWTADNSWVYVGEYFNLWVSDKTMPVGNEVKLTLYTSQPTVPAGHEVVLKPLNGATINGNAGTISFNETAYGAFASYTLVPGATSPALEVTYMGSKEVSLPL